MCTARTAHSIHVETIAKLIFFDLKAVLLSLFVLLGPEPAFGRLGLGALPGGYSYYGYTSHASLRAYGTQLGGDSLFLGRLTKHF